MTDRTKRDILMIAAPAAAAVATAGVAAAALEPAKAHEAPMWVEHKDGYTRVMARTATGEPWCVVSVEDALVSRVHDEVIAMRMDTFPGFVPLHNEFYSSFTGVHVSVRSEEKGPLIDRRNAAQ